MILFSLKSKYRQAIPARFFLWHNPPLPPKQIWFHACSFGETRALKPLVEAVGRENTSVTTTTQTGFSEAASLVKQRRYLPFEPLLWLWVRPQRALVVMEAELWYLLFLVAKRRGAKTLLVNARISDRSYPAYRRFAWFYRRIFAQVDAVFAQSETDRKRLEELGARHVKVCGNIKLAYLPKATRKIAKPEGIVVTAASTHEGEEEGIVEAFLRWRRNHPDARLVVVPRHPERFGKVAAFLERVAKKEGLSYGRWSEEESLNRDITLIDAMGELVNLYAVTDIVVLGGAFVPVGGHNPAEAVPFGCRLVTGPHIFNQKAMFEAVEGAHFCEAGRLQEGLEEAWRGGPLRLRTPVSLEPIVKELRDVV
ncbi:lipid IV(A) 3-deoxy-D-manno-octulosonic acid transferase [Hydrogenimonas sp. SS33]|uniref:lipid IV(A) 3-deoxy-D-manno-octulosonic acid transferase n=1 Tax=Hydrogenimonas leucolamina TaxID=2954236 RepID=UPI00336C2E0E